MDAKENTCRGDILGTLAKLAALHGRSEFTSKEISQAMEDAGGAYSPKTIESHVRSKMCLNASVSHSKTYNDLISERPGFYRLATDEEKAGKGIASRLMHPDRRRGKSTWP